MCRCCSSPSPWIPSFADPYRRAVACCSWQTPSRQTSRRRRRPAGAHRQAGRQARGQARQADPRLRRHPRRQRRGPARTHRPRPHPDRPRRGRRRVGQPRRGHLRLRQGRRRQGRHHAPRRLRRRLRRQGPYRPLRVVPDGGHPGGRPGQQLTAGAGRRAPGRTPEAEPATSPPPRPLSPPGAALRPRSAGSRRGGADGRTSTAHRSVQPRCGARRARPRLLRDPPRRRGRRTRPGPRRHQLLRQLHRPRRYAAGARRCWAWSRTARPPATWPAAARSAPTGPDVCCCAAPASARSCWRPAPPAS